jgi:hypothetical protein
LKVTEHMVVVAAALDTEATIVSEARPDCRSNPAPSISTPGRELRDNSSLTR